MSAEKETPDEKGKAPDARHFAKSAILISASF
jgi:hypothetical protein